MILLVFTSSYPYDGQHEETFLAPELPHLVKGFGKVILVPQVREGNLLPVTEGVEVDESYAVFLERANKIIAFLKVLTSKYFYRDLLSHPFIWTRPSALFRLASYVGGAQLTQKWVEEWLARSGFPDQECIFYTFWFDAATFGIGLVKQRYPALKIISRAHGYDIYKERYPVPYLPCRLQALSKVDGVFPDSLAGTDYLRTQFPSYAAKIKMARMGVPDPGFLTHASTDGVLRLISCAIIRPVKRINLILEGVAEAARQRPYARFEWHHFGNGETAGVREALEAYAKKLLPPNAQAYFPGYSGQQDLFRFYQEQFVDVFVNVSISEGTAVSIMEAISCGIPVIATAVGGNREIVSHHHNGILLSPNPTPEEIAQALFYIIEHPNDLHHWRVASRVIWNEKYNVERNIEKFIEEIKHIRDAA